MSFLFQFWLHVKISPSLLYALLQIVLYLLHLPLTGSSAPDWFQLLH